MLINKLIVGFTGLMPKKVVRLFANKYIAGDTLQDAVDTVKAFNNRGILATIDVLGEAIEKLDDVHKYQREALAVFDAIEKNNLQANLSIKPTQFGLMLDEEVCYNHVVELLERAEEIDNFVRLDMEDSETTDKIIALYKRLLKRFKNVGIVFQAYLKRTCDDVDELNKIQGHYRLCKGIYIEPERIAYKGKQEVRDNFMKVLELMLRDGQYVGIATHDKWLVEESYKLVEKLDTPKDKYEFQMLLGVEENLRDKIVADGHKMRVYVPYGEDWYKYSIRRLQENPNMAGHIVKNIFNFT